MYFNVLPMYVSVNAVFRKMNYIAIDDSTDSITLSSAIVIKFAERHGIFLRQSSSNYCMFGILHCIEI